jgi:hypothetical protein
MVDFLHRTLRDFLATERMKKMLETWAAQELNVFTAISRALIAECKFIDATPSAAGLKLAVQFANQGAVETGDTADYFSILYQMGLAFRRLRCSSVGTEVNFPVTAGIPQLGCRPVDFMVRAAISAGHTEYVRYRLCKKDSTLELGRALRHAVNCPSGPDANLTSILLEDLDQLYATADSYRCFSSCNAIDNIPATSVIELLLDHGADPNKRFEQTSTMSILIGQMTEWMDGEQQDQRWDIVRTFLTRGGDLNQVGDQWYFMLNRDGNTAENVLRNTLIYFQRFFAHGLNPDTMTEGTTISIEFLRILAKDTSNTSEVAQSIQTELLCEILRHGANVSTVYTDTSSEGWLNMVSRELAWHSTSKLAPSRIAQLRMMLEHGLDPNAKILQTTVWKHLLDIICISLQRGLLDKSYDHSVYQIVLLALDYGADPRTVKLQDVLRWAKSSSCRLSPVEVWEMERAVQREIYQESAKTPMCKCGLAHLTHRGPCASCENGSANREEIRQGQKRNAEYMSHSRHHCLLKKARFNE